MAIEIKSGNSSDLQTIDAISKAARVTLYNSDGIEGTREIPVEITVAPVTALNDDIISSIDVSEYAFISLQLDGVWDGTVTFQGSNTNGTFHDIISKNASDDVAPLTATSTINSLFKIPTIYKYFRVKVTAYNSGTVTGAAWGYKEDIEMTSVGQIGIVTLSSETTKVIGTVNVSAESNSKQGVITAADTAVIAPSHDGVLLSGTSSVDSYVFIESASSESTWTVELTGVLGGSSFYFEGSSGSTNGIDGNWISLNANQTGLAGNVLHHQATTEGKFSGNIAGIKYFRVRAVGGVGINAAVDVRLAAGSRSVFLNESIPAGDNAIGTIEVTNLPASQTVDGTISVSNLPVSQTVDGSVSVSNFPASGATPAGTNNIGSVSIVAGAAPLTTDFYSSVAANGPDVNNNSRMLRVGACILRAAVMTNYAATSRIVKIYDTGVTPVAGAGTPVLVLSLPAAGTLAYPLPAEGFEFKNGIGMTMVQKAPNNDTTGTATFPDISLTSIFT